MAWHNEHTNGQPRRDMRPDKPPRPPLVRAVLALAYLFIGAATIWTAFVAWHTLLMSYNPYCTAAQIVAIVAPWLVFGSLPLFATGFAIRFFAERIARVIARLLRR